MVNNRLSPGLLLFIAVSTSKIHTMIFITDFKNSELRMFFSSSRQVKAKEQH